MNEKINTLKARQKQLQTLGIVFMLAAVLCLILLFKFPACSTLLFFALLVFYLVVIRRGIRQYKKAVKTAILEECFRSSLKDITYCPKGGVPRETIADAGFIPVEHTKNLLVNDSVCGRYKAMPAFVTDVTTDFQSVRTTKSGEQKSFLDFLSGCYFDVELPDRKTFSGSITIWPKESIPMAAIQRCFAGQQSFTSPAAQELEQDFLLFTRDCADVPVLPEAFLKAVLRLAEYTPGSTAVQLADGHLRIFIQNRFLYTSPVKVRTAVTPQLLNYNQFPEISYILRVADTMF